MPNWPRTIGRRKRSTAPVLMLVRQGLLRPLLLLLLLPAVASACREETPPPAPLPSPTPSPVLNIGLADSAAPVATLVGDAFEAARPGIEINFLPANNATLFADLEQGMLDALLVHYLPPDSDYWYNPVAMDGLAVVVHPDNGVSALERGQIQALYNGRIGRWATLGGGEREVSLVGRERGSGDRLLFNQQVMAEQRASINMLIQPDPAALLAAVAADPGAIGYTMMGIASGTEGVVPVAVDGVPPTPNSAGTQNYPLTAPLYFVAPAEPAGPGSGGALRAFLAWLQADEGQLILSEKYGRVR